MDEKDPSPDGIRIFPADPCDDRPLWQNHTDRLWWNRTSGPARIASRPDQVIIPDAIASRKLLREHRL